MSGNQASSAAHPGRGAQVPSGAKSPERLVVVRRKDPLQWGLTAIALILFALFLEAVATNPNFDWPTVGHYLFHPRILSGMSVTILVTALVMVLGAMMGTLVALMLRSSNPVLRIPAQGYVWFFRGAPALVQLIFWYNLSLLFPTISLTLPGIGTVFSIPTNDVMTPMLTALLAFSLVTGGYLAETIRAGIGAVGTGQYEAAAAQGLRHGQIMRHIVFPQAIRIILPPAGNEAINVLKSTALVSVIALGDVLYSAQSIYARTFETIPLLLVATIWYLAAVTVLTFGQRWLERHFAQGASA